MTEFTDTDKSHELRYGRGDSFTSEFIIKDNAEVVIDITGFSFKLTVNTVKNPELGTPTGSEKFSLTGIIPTGTDGKVQFTPTVSNTNITPETYWYDIQMTDGSGAIRTILKAHFVIVQDITK